MRVTRVTYVWVNLDARKTHIATCDVVLDDCLMLSGIRLCQGDKGYYLIFPSKQDVYREVKFLNEDVDIIYPLNNKDGFTPKGNCYEEFFHPVKKTFYDVLLNDVVTGFSVCVSDGIILKSSYKPK